MRSYKKYLQLNLFIIFTLFFSELTLIFYTTGSFDNLKNIFLFSVSLGAVIAFIIALIGRMRLDFYITLGFMILVYAFFVSETLLYRAFGFFYPPETVFNMAHDVVGSYSGGILNTVLSGYAPVFLLLLPVYLFFSLKGFILVGRKKPSGVWIIFLVLGIALHFFTVTTLENGANGEPSDIDYYREGFDFNEGVKRFGLAESLRLNVMYSFKGVPSEEGEIPDGKGDVSLDKTAFFNANALQIDFESIRNSTSDKRIIEMCDYFSSVLPSEKNEYTGIFKGKNLIFICAEAFSPYSVSKERTPTIYKLINEGFSFTDYYQPSFGESTSGGEYSLLLGQVPKRDSGEKGMSFSLTCKENLSYSMPALFGKEGYKVSGFHNNSYTYYGRNVTHPKMGMNWYGCYGCVTNDGSYLDLDKVLSGGWPRLDSELIAETVELYASEGAPFFTYYLTVSGHNNYSFEENTAARKNRDSVKDINCSERVKAYLAAQHELEKALSELIFRLENAGVLGETVIALSNDHYPYGLSPSWQGNGGNDYISELYGKNVKSTAEREKGAFFIWCEGMDGGVRITKPTSSFDVLPTLLNLFGIEYDSRLFAGRDALADGEGFVFFSDGSWRADAAEYDAKKNSVTVFSEVSEEYIRERHKAVKSRVLYSKLLRQKEFFKIIAPFL